MSNRYTPIMRLGAGGMGELWLGVLEGAAGYRRPVVMKRAATTTDVAADLEDAEKNLVREAHVAAALQHPNVIHVYELIAPPEGLMLIMEFLDGFSLRYVMKAMAEDESVLPLGIALRVLADAARGLSYAHRAAGPDGQGLEIVHRDVTPENLVITAEGITKVVDFGIARSTLKKHTTEAVVKGKVPYFSPEQARGQTLDWRSDAFAFGAVLFEAITGRKLFLRPTRGETLRAVLFDPVEELPEWVPATVRDAFRRLMTREAEHRDVDMQQVADILEVAAAMNQGATADVRRFMETEMGPRVAARRTRIAELIERPRIVVHDMTDPLTETMVAIEIVLSEDFDDETRALGSGAGVLGDETLVDQTEPDFDT